MSINVPPTPIVIKNISPHESLSLIVKKASNATEIGPVVKLMVLAIDNGIIAIAQYCMTFDIMARVDLKTTTATTLKSCANMLKLVPFYALPYAYVPIIVRACRSNTRRETRSPLLKPIFAKTLKAP